MFAQLVFNAQDFHNALMQITPLRVRLDKHNDDRYLQLARPREVTLVAGAGVRIVTQAQLQWDVIGIRVPITLRQGSVLLLPSVETVDDSEALVFAARVEEADLSAVPAFVEGGIVARVNEALARPEARFAWPFMRKLDFRFALPKTVEPERELNLFAKKGAVHITDDLLTVSVGWGLIDRRRATRTVEPAVEGAREAESRP
jgi:hypothetical protein